VLPEAADLAIWLLLITTPAAALDAENETSFALIVDSEATALLAAERSLELFLVIVAALAPAAARVMDTDRVRTAVALEFATSDLT
jgi:hypothetical protein